MSLFGRLFKLLRWLAMASLAIMMIITIVDVSMRFLLNELLLGSVELVQLALVAVVFFALPESFAREQHITVDVLDQVLGPEKVRMARRVAALATLALIAFMAWRTIPPALDTIEIGDRSSDLLISFVWYWLPIVIGSVAAALAALLCVLGKAGDSDVNADSGDEGI